MQEHDGDDVDDIRSDMPNAQPPLVQISKAARLSAVFALAGPVCFIVFLSPLGWPFVFIPMLGSILIRAAPILSAIAFVLGVFGLASIAFSGGRRTGYAYAMVGIGVPLMGVLILSLTVIPRIRALDHRMTCGTNLSGIGKAMLLYTNDNDDAFPRAGGRRGVWTARTPSWAAKDRRDAYALGDPNAEDGRAGISSSLYLLIKYAEVTPKVFVCPSDKKTTVFKPRAYGVDGNMVDLWDFGPNPPKHCSYAYQMVYTPFQLRTSGDPGFAILADRSPWIDSPSSKAKDFAGYRPDLKSYNGTAKQACVGNTTSHRRDNGQNVLFLDSHVEFEKRPFCGLQDDNIYTISGKPATGDPVGKPPTFGSHPSNARDSLLVNDPALSSR
jgi:hypothetical protein